MSIERVLGREAAAETRQVYDVAHNVAKIEVYDGKELCARAGLARRVAQLKPLGVVKG